MRAMMAAAVAALVVTGCGESVDGEPDTEEVSNDQTPSNDLRRANFVDAEGGSVGYVEYGTDGSNLSLLVEATGLSDGSHAVHLHETGSCEGPEFQSAGGHWNPRNNEHGRDNPQGAHLGDLANMSVGADGAGRAEFIVEGATISSGQFALNDSDGTALMIHAGADDYRTDPGGDAGARVACAVLAAPQGETARGGRVSQDNGPADAIDATTTDTATTREELNVGSPE